MCFCLPQGAVVESQTKKQCLEIDVICRQRCEVLDAVTDMQKDADGCVPLRVAQYLRPVVIRGKFGR
jgi:hypothetical protein